MILLQKRESRQIVDSVRDDSSSLLWLRDDESCCTQKTTITETSEFLDTSFTFDREIFNCKPYQVAIRSNMKQAVRGSSAMFRGKGASRNNLLDPWDGNARQTVSQLSENSLPQRGLRGRAALESLRNDEGFASDGSREAQQEVSAPSGTALENHTNSAAGSLTYSSRSSIASGEDFSTPKGISMQVLRRGLHFPNLLKSRSTFSTTSLHSINSEKAVRPARSASHGDAKILLIGSTVTTRSTLLSSMKLAYGNHYTRSEKESFKTSIFNNIIEYMQTVLEEMVSLELPLDNNENSKYASSLLSQPIPIRTSTIPAVIATALIALRHDSGVVKYAQRSVEFLQPPSFKQYVFLPLGSNL